MCTHKHILPVNHRAKYYLFLFYYYYFFLSLFKYFPAPASKVAEMSLRRCSWIFRLDYSRASHHLPRSPAPKTERGRAVVFVLDSSEALFGFIRSKESPIQARSSSTAVLERLVPRAQTVTRRGPLSMAPGTTNPIRGLHSQTGPPQHSGLVMVTEEEA